MIDPELIRRIVREELARALAKPAPEHMTQAEAADYCKVTTVTLRKWHREGLKVARRGKVVRYAKADLDAFLRGREATKDPAAMAAEFLKAS